MTPKVYVRFWVVGNFTVVVIRLRNLDGFRLYLKGVAIRNPTDNYRSAIGVREAVKHALIGVGPGTRVIAWKEALRVARERGLMSS